MTRRISAITRRQLLGCVGTTAIATAGVRRASVTADAPAYTSYTYAQTAGDDGPQLRVAWYSTYNGEPTNATSTGETGDGPLEEYVDDYDVETHGPLVREMNVLPGDSGTIGIGLVAEEMNARVRLFPSVSGRLSEVIDVSLWYDTGIFGIGGCAGTATVPANPDLECSLAQFGEAYGPDTEGLLLRPGLGDCLPEGERLCLGIAWWTATAISNEWQGESVEFELAVGAEQCGVGR